MITNQQATHCREEVSQVTLLTRLLALVDNIRDRNQIKYREGRVINVKSVESSVTKVALCVRPSVSICRMYQCVSLGVRAPQFVSMWSSAASWAPPSEAEG